MPKKYTGLSTTLPIASPTRGLPNIQQFAPPQRLGGASEIMPSFAQGQAMAGTDNGKNLGNMLAQQEMMKFRLSNLEQKKAETARKAKGDELKADITMYNDAAKAYQMSPTDPNMRILTVARNAFSEHHSDMGIRFTPPEIIPGDPGAAQKALDWGASIYNFVAGTPATKQPAAASIAGQKSTITPGQQDLLKLAGTKDKAGHVYTEAEIRSSKKWAAAGKIQ